MTEFGELPMCTPVVGTVSGIGKAILGLEPVADLITYELVMESEADRRLKGAFRQEIDRRTVNAAEGGLSVLLKYLAEKVARDLHKQTGQTFHCVTVYETTEKLGEVVRKIPLTFGWLWKRPSVLPILPPS